MPRRGLGLPSHTPATVQCSVNHADRHVLRIKPSAPRHTERHLALHHAIRLIGPEVGLIVADVSARSLRAGGAMTLICAQVDENIIRLLGRWQSDAMLHYLNIQARPVMRNFAAQMLQHGMYDLVQNVQQQNPQAD
jgi:hypothetical protein